MHQRRHVDLNELATELTERRFDGGTEIDLIAQIEAKQKNQQHNQPRSATPRGVGKANHTTRPQAHAKAQSLQGRAMETNAGIPLEGRASKPNRIKHAVDTLMVGPLQIAVGIVGMLTSGLAMASFRKAGDEALQAQSKSIFKDCSLTLLIGLYYTVVSPLRCIKTLLLGPTLARVS